eukprot:6197680-Pleurochrysis_carterae.AAC.1
MSQTDVLRLTNSPLRNRSAGSVRNTLCEVYQGQGARAGAIVDYDISASYSCVACNRQAVCAVLCVRLPQASPRTKIHFGSVSSHGHIMKARIQLIQPRSLSSRRTSSYTSYGSTKPMQKKDPSARHIK